ncbi:hypothetical protein ALQ57_102126 [Pseudomonas amygdali pv. hibisci]|uniref:Uncharacterized protein n=3 Tax=Pseudomonas amygdali TaxID=47877 RepID=A0AAX1W312_PSEAJ|nr:hypothetical protein ALO67_102079 [Pseudomonas amygdali pv. hibisci]KPX75851.1 hypothetical protein ALO35_102753 [Pseudomonas amygdali pv. lachrymans]KPY85213.1 hypothetical protein ALO60_102149 [Pseudomonas amygdali pv. tabaci]RML84246.1 hypothetical protein ALQ89_100779 [Pseudomonas amygdali pv. tabaci]RMN53588.1 hypothetical protein ALQ57_102126 [Pseudomonas amygdali pv. hibisci]
MLWSTVRVRVGPPYPKPRVARLLCFWRNTSDTVLWSKGTPSPLSFRTIRENRPFQQNRPKAAVQIAAQFFAGAGAGGSCCTSVQSTIATGAAAGGAMFSLVGSAGVFVETAILMMCWPRCWLRCVSGCLLFMAVPGPGQRCIVDKMPRGAAAAAQTQIWRAVEQGVLS